MIANMRETRVNLGDACSCRTRQRPLQFSPSFHGTKRAAVFAGRDRHYTHMPGPAELEFPGSGGPPACPRAGHLARRKKPEADTPPKRLPSPGPGGETPPSTEGGTPAATPLYSGK